MANGLLDIKKRKGKGNNPTPKHKGMHCGPNAEWVDGWEWPVVLTHLRWEFLLLFTWPLPVQPGVGHLRTFSYIARTLQTESETGKVRSPRAGYRLALIT